MDKIGTYQFLTEPFHCDFSQQLTMPHLGNHLLNAADFHSNDRNFGMKYLMPRNRTWVLSRLAIDVIELPQAYDRFQIKTWVESAMRFFTNRNFKVMDESGNKVYALGKSIWALIDTESRQPADIFAIRNGEIKQWETTSETCEMDKPTRIAIKEETKTLRQIETRYSDVDMNGHINSIKYIEHALDIWTVDFYKTHRIKRIEAAYVAESKPGDILIYSGLETCNNDFSIKIERKTTLEEKLTEVCRLRVVFE